MTAAAPRYDLDAPPPKDVHKLRAHEIWGGNGPTTGSIMVPGFEAWLHARPYAGSNAGGDLRFVSTCAAGQIVRFTIADLTGHGDEASEFAARLRSLIRKHMNMPNPTRFVQALNIEMSSLPQHERMATAIVQTYFAPTDHLIVCNAGHPRPLLFRTAEGRWIALDEKSPGTIEAGRSSVTGIANLPLGVLAPTRYPVFAIQLQPGDLIVAYTDAFMEAANPEGKMLGEAGFLDLVSSIGASDPAALGRAILEGVETWRRGAAAKDDETLLILRHTASDPPDSPWARARALARLVGLAR